MSTPLKPPTTLLIGPTGVGKTYSISTYLEAGLEVFVLFTDAGGEESLLDALTSRSIPVDNLHYHYVPSTSHSFEQALATASRVSTMSYEALSILKGGLNKSDYRQYLHVMKAFMDFPCDRTGLTFGPVEDFDSSRVLVVDSMSGINKMIKRLVVGAKPTLHQGEWGTAMEVEELFLDLLTGNLSCYLLCTAHIEKSIDYTTGKPLIMSSFLGSKLAPKIPLLFSDVILAYRSGSSFQWSSIADGYDLKTRNFPLSNTIKPSFQPLVTKHTTRLQSTQPKGKAND